MGKLVDRIWAKNISIDVRIWPKIGERSYIWMWAKKLNYYQNLSEKVKFKQFKYAQFPPIKQFSHKFCQSYYFYSHYSIDQIVHSKILPIKYFWLYSTRIISIFQSAFFGNSNYNNIFTQILMLIKVFFNSNSLIQIFWLNSFQAIKIL